MYKKAAPLLSSLQFIEQMNRSSRAEEREAIKVKNQAFNTSRQRLQAIEDVQDELEDQFSDIREQMDELDNTGVIELGDDTDLDDMAEQDAYLRAKEATVNAVKFDFGKDIAEKQGAKAVPGAIPDKQPCWMHFFDPNGCTKGTQCMKSHDIKLMKDVAWKQHSYWSKK
jgi:hypothetical protein